MDNKNTKKVDLYKVNICILIALIIIPTVVIIVLSKVSYFDNDLSLLKIDRKVYIDATPNYIPDGFKYIEGNLNSGYVIQDKAGDQFVWVPIDDNKIVLQRVTFDKDISQISIEDCNDNNEDDFINSVKKYKGFYVARFEAGKQDNNLVFKKDVDVYNNVDYNQAKSLSEGFSKTINTNTSSDLISSYAWDSICEWLSDVSNINNKNKSYINFSIGMGNYLTYIKSQKDVKLEKTGSSESYKTKNIYDLAGNVAELTTEKNIKDNMPIIRGGMYNLPADFANVSSRLLYSKPSDYIGFRTILYMK